MPTATRKPAPAKKPAPDPLRLLDEATSPVDRLEQEIHRQRRQVVEVQQKLDDERRQLAFLEGKAAKIAQLITNGGALAREVDAKPFDAKLAGLLKKCKQAPWTKLQRAGATDDQIMTILSTGWPPYAYGSAPTRAESNYGNPRVFIDNRDHRPTLEGKPLIAEVRRVMGIPQPKPAAKPKPGAKKPASGAANTLTVTTSVKKKPAAKKGGKGGTGGSGATKVSAAGFGAAEDDDGDEDLDAAANDTAVVSTDPANAIHVVRPAGAVGLPKRDKPYSLAEAGLTRKDVKGCERFVYPGGPTPVGRRGSKRQPGKADRTWLIHGRSYYAIGIGWNGADGSEDLYLAPLYTPEEWGNRKTAIERNDLPEYGARGGQLIAGPGGRQWVAGPEAESIDIRTSPPEDGKSEQARPAATAAAAADQDAGDVEIPAIPAHVGKMTLTLWRDAARGEWYCGADVDLKPGNLGTKVIRPLSRPAFPDRAAAIADTAAHLLDLAEAAERALPKAKVVNGRAVVEGLKAFVKGLAPPAAAAADPDEARAETIAELPADRRHLMRDKRVNDHGVYTDGVEVLSTHCPAGSAQIHLVADGDGAWHSSTHLKFKRATLGECGGLPSVSGERYPTRAAAIEAELGDLLASCGDGRNRKPAERRDVAKMRECLESWRAKLLPAGEAGSYQLWVECVRIAVSGAKAAVDVDPDDADLRSWYAAGEKPTAAAGLLRAREVRRSMGGGGGGGSQPSSLPDPKPAKPNGRGGPPLHPVAAAVLATGGPLVTGVAGGPLN